MIDERKVCKLDLSICDREILCVDKVIVAHIVDLDLALMVGIKEFDHVVFTVTEQLVEALSWQPHGNHTICDVAQVEIKSVILITVTVHRDKAFQYKASFRLLFSFSTLVDLLHEVGICCQTEPIDLLEVDPIY